MEMQQLSSRDALTIARIVRVNHAGEFGAIRIYSAQILVARWLCPDCLPALTEMLGHEREHCAAFHAAMPKRNSRPCRVMRLWSLGGWLLGFATALLGRQGVWACTAAVEATVHRHLDDQLHFLTKRDPEFHSIILSIREEELAHLHHAEAQLRSPGRLVDALRQGIALTTDVLIWLSTWGDSMRMERALRAAKIG
jgi:ubiquinone biosynthesis monooxygenase Coq7